MRKPFTNKPFSKLKQSIALALCLVLGACSSLPMPMLGSADKSTPVQEQAQNSVQGSETTTDPASKGEAKLPMANSMPVVEVPKLNAGTQALFDRAVALLQQGKLTSAQVLFEEITLDQPELAGPWVNLGYIHLQQGDQTVSDNQAQATEAFLSALKANPKNCDALTQLGVLARREGKFAEAESYYQACIDAQPMYANAHLNLGILYELYMGRLGEALAAYNDYQVMAAEPDQRVVGWVMDLERRVEAIAKR